MYVQSYQQIQQHLGAPKICIRSGYQFPTLIPTKFIFTTTHLLSSALPVISAYACVSVCLNISVQKSQQYLEGENENQIFAQTNAVYHNFIVPARAGLRFAGIHTHIHVYMYVCLFICLYMCMYTTRIAWNLHMFPWTGLLCLLQWFLFVLLLTPTCYRRRDKIVFSLYFCISTAKLTTVCTRLYGIFILLTTS